MIDDKTLAALDEGVRDARQQRGLRDDGQGMKTKRQQPRGVAEFETVWLAKKLTESWAASGLNKTKWLKSLGIRDESAKVHVSYLLSGQRGLQFFKGVRLATAAGIDLSELQRWLE